MVTLTTQDFVDKVRLVARVAQGNNSFTFDQFLSLGDLCMRTLVAPKIASARENYWLTTVTYETEPGLNKYPIPGLAQGNAIVDAKVDVSQNLIHLGRLEIGDLWSFQYSPFAGYGYYIEDNYVRLNPTSLNGQLILWYYREPSELVATTECAQISAINYGTATVTVGTIPSSFIGSDIELDIVKQTPGFNVLKKDAVPVSIVGMDITFDDVPLDVAVGDYVCLSGQSCVIQCPLEWTEVLVQATATKVLETQGYERRYAMAKKELDNMVENAMKLVSPRTIESAKIIYAGGSLLVPQNTGSFLPVRNV